jgi:hypothetical protein
MRALIIRDPDGNVTSVTVVHTGEDIPGDFSPVVPAGHRLDEIDITKFVEKERSASKSEREAVARAMSHLRLGT